MDGVLKQAEERLMFLSSDPEIQKEYKPMKLAESTMQKKKVYLLSFETC